ncbi:hypothetical protein H0H92_003682 [Tricholoma furcatifolium]|nr:hypothetical protein H0H92_003682 [Tricholoma furcatifolium]
MAAYCGTWSWSVCERFAPPVHILFMPCQLLPQAVMLMRAYAFSGRDTRILALLLACYAGLFSVDVWSFCTNISTLPEIVFILLDGTGCYPYYGKGYMGFRVGYSMLAATLMDLISLIIVLAQCLRKTNSGLALARYFLKQGLISFGLVIAVNLIAAGLFFDQSSPNNGLGLPFVMTVSNLIACRVILGLRRKVSPSDEQIDARNSVLVREAFASPLTVSRSDQWLMPAD